MKSSDVINPLIVREAYPKEYADKAAIELGRMFTSLEDIVLGKLPQEQGPGPNAMSIWSLQRGINLASPSAAAIGNVLEIINTLNGMIGYKCDPIESSARVQLQKSDWSKLPWHQDGAGMRAAADSIVAWVPLTAIDGSCPTIEFANLQMEQKLEHERNSNYFLEVEGIGDTDSSIVNDIEPGTVVIFSPWTLHRTHRTKTMNKARLSLDLRFYAD